MKKLIKIITLLFILTLTVSFAVGCNIDNDDANPPETGHTCNEDCTYTATEWFDDYRHYPKTLKCNQDSSVIVRRTKIEISSADEFLLLSKDLKDGNYVGTTDFLFTKDIDMSGKVWTPIDFRVSKAHAYYEMTLTFDGNGKAIKNLTMSQNYEFSAGIFGEVTGEINFVFKNLTIDGAKIYSDTLDQSSNRGVGAFIGLPNAIKGNITVSNCTLKNSEIKGAHWAGGFFGYIRKENPDRDTGKIIVKIENSSVESTTIESKGSAGGMIGHAGGCQNVKILATNVTVKNSTVTSLGSSTIKSGAFAGTIGRAQVTLTTTESFSGNTVRSGAQENTQRIYYGRFGDSTDIESGRLSVNGNAVTPQVN